MEHEMRYIMCRVELANPDTDWERSWMLARLPGLGPENVSFLFKIMHQILPTQESVVRTSPRTNPECPMPGSRTERELWCGSQDDDMSKELCTKSRSFLSCKI